MTDLLQDRLNLQILSNICSGKGISVNYSKLSKKLNKHRNTIKKKVQTLFKNKIINQPIYPFFGQYREHPIMIMVQAEIPINKKTEDWIAKDPHIFAAFKIKKEQYDILLFLYHRNILRYQLWRRSLIKEGKIPPRYTRNPSTATFISTQTIIKYEPSANIQILEQELKKQKKLTLNNQTIDQLSLQILKNLLEGDCIKTNENLIANKIGVHRNTIKHRIKKLLQHNLILKPTCRFPSFFCPPDSILTISMMEVLKKEKEIIEQIRKDPHTSVAFQICTGRYNYLLFKTFERIKDHIEWEHKLYKKFPHCFGLTDTTYVTPNMTISMDQQKVSLALIRKKIELLNNPQTEEEVWNPFVKEI